MKQQIKGKTIVITGGSGGLGKEICFQLGQLGANIIALDIDESNLSQLNQELDDSSIPNLCLQCNITEPDECNTTFNTVIETFGKVDILVNNAGISHLGYFEEVGTSQIQRLMNVNFFGAANCTQSALPSIIQNKGMVVAISSVAGLAPVLGRTAYVASKFAMNGFFETLRAELKSKNIHVLIVSPSFIDTPMRSRSAGLGDTGDNQLQYATGKSATPEDVAKLIVKAIVKKKRMMTNGFIGWTSYWMRRLLPRLFEKLMIKKQQDKFESES